MEREIREGMTVRSSDGEKLGKVIQCGADEFIIEKGFFFPKDYVARYEQASVDGDEVLLSLPASSLREAGEAGGAWREDAAIGKGTQPGTYEGGMTAGESVEGGSRLAHGTSEQVRVPVAEEVRVSKTARREERRAEGDVRRETVDVEREGDVEERGGAAGEGTVREPEE